jgi:FMN phosphatase YigB (HAD superfamily)
MDEDAQRGRLEALEGVYATQLGAPPEYPADKASPEARIEWLQSALLERLKPAPAALEELARSRAQAVRAALLANPELGAERVFIVANRGEAAIAGGLVRMEMKLE